MADRFEDERGIIQDLLGPVDAVTEIHTVKGAIRGNHVHKLTTQWTYVVSGCLRMAFAADGHTYFHEAGPGQLVCEAPDMPHAWQALEDTTVLVFTRGPRSGEAYESDTERLEVPLLP
jgi:quercetin dioxygenase-like cupin family protein